MGHAGLTSDDTYIARRWLGGRLEDRHLHPTWTSSLSLPLGTEGDGLQGRYCRVPPRKSHLSPSLFRGGGSILGNQQWILGQGKIVVQITRFSAATDRVPVLSLKLLKLISRPNMEPLPPGCHISKPSFRVPVTPHVTRNTA